MTLSIVHGKHAGIGLEFCGRRLQPGDQFYNKPRQSIPPQLSFAHKS